MSFFSFGKKEPSLSFVFDIRDTSITVAATKFFKDKKPQIVLCSNYKIESKDKSDYTLYISEMLKTIEKASVSMISELVKTGNKEKIGEYYLFFGSPWSISQSKVIKIEKDRLSLVDEKFLKQIINKQEESFIDKIESETNEKNWVVIEEKIIQSKLNGYKVNKIHERKAKKIEIEFLISFIPKEIQDKLNGVIKQKIKTNSYSTIISSFSFLRDAFSDRNDFIYFDINDSITDVYVVRDDVLCEISSFPIGEKDIIREISKNTNTPEEIVSSLVNIKYDENHDPKEDSRIDALVDVGLKYWLESFNSAIGKMCSIMNSPNNVFIMANSSITKLFAEKMMKDGRGKEFEILGVKINPYLIREEMFNDLVNNAKAFNNESYVKLDVVFLDKILRIK